MKKGRGFTLVELLVVIAIIALLMSIMLPAMSRVRKQAKAVICQSNLKQWALIFAMYTEDYDGQFCEGETPGGQVKLWTGATRPYYQDPKIRLCSMATKLWRDGGHGTFGAWDLSGLAGPVQGWGGDDPNDYGSYGLNEWLYNPSAEIEYLWGSPTKFSWRHINVKGAYNIPMFLDCWWLGGGPTHMDSPPVYEGETFDENFNDMKRFCLNRHNKAISGCFLDFSIRKIPLKCLWTFKWNRGYDLTLGSPRWPSWMESYPECD